MFSFFKMFKREDVDQNVDQVEETVVAENNLVTTEEPVEETEESTVADDFIEGLFYGLVGCIETTVRDTLDAQKELNINTNK